LADDAEAFIASAVTVVGGVIPLLSFAVNAFVPPAQPHLAYESGLATA
jgi:hypothetical protein